MKVIKLIAKTGITKIDFKSLFLDLKPRIKSEVKTAKKEKITVPNSVAVQRTILIKPKIKDPQLTEGHVKEEKPETDKGLHSEQLNGE